MDNNTLLDQHTFVICAFGESPYLEECIKSLKNQSIQTNILIATSTPNDLILNIADKYEIPLYVNPKGSEGIASDWNFALSCADTSYVTIAHQDDIYQEDYIREVLDSCNAADHPLIAFTDYSEIRDGKEVTANRLLRIKRFMLLLLKNQRMQKSIWLRRRILSFGSAICCPSVTYNIRELPSPVFLKGFRSDLDWEAWERISRLSGSFVYCPKILMSHRIHADSATTAIIEDHGRTKEDLEMYQRFWPKWVAKMLEHYYQDSEKQNEKI